jgi:hypothetical protein
MDIDYKLFFLGLGLVFIIAIQCYLSHLRKVKVKKLITRVEGGEDMTKILIDILQLQGLEKLPEEKTSIINNEIHGYQKESQLPEYRIYLSPLTVEYECKEKEKGKRKRKTEIIEDVDICNMQTKKRELGKMYLTEPLSNISKTCTEIQVKLSTHQEMKIIGKIQNCENIKKSYHKISEEKLKEIEGGINEGVRKRVLCLLNEIQRNEDNNFDSCLTLSFDKLLSFFEQKITK